MKKNTNIKKAHCLGIEVPNNTNSSFQTMNFSNEFINKIINLDETLDKNSLNLDQPKITKFKYKINDDKKDGKIDNLVNLNNVHHLLAPTIASAIQNSTNVKRQQVKMKVENNNAEISYFSENDDNYNCNNVKNNKNNQPNNNNFTFKKNNTKQKNQNYQQNQTLKNNTSVQNDTSVKNNKVKLNNKKQKNIEKQSRVKQPKSNSKSKFDFITQGETTIIKSKSLLNKRNQNNFIVNLLSLALIELNPNDCESQKDFIEKINNACEELDSKLIEYKNNNKQRQEYKKAVNAFKKSVYNCLINNLSNNVYNKNQKIIKKNINYIITNMIKIKFEALKPNSENHFKNILNCLKQLKTDQLYSLIKEIESGVFYTTLGSKNPNVKIQQSLSQAKVLANILNHQPTDQDHNQIEEDKENYKISTFKIEVFKQASHDLYENFNNLFTKPDSSEIEQSEVLKETINNLFIVMNSINANKIKLEVDNNKSLKIYTLQELQDLKTISDNLIKCVSLSNNSNYNLNPSGALIFHLFNLSKPILTVFSQQVNKQLKNSDNNSMGNVQEKSIVLYGDKK